MNWYCSSGATCGRAERPESNIFARATVVRELCTLLPSHIRRGSSKYLLVDGEPFCFSCPSKNINMNKHPCERTGQSLVFN
ncbi:hypothetical protein YC2023_041462 [Brassica napus]